MLAVAVLLVLAAGGLFAARKYLKPVVKEWRIDRYNADAREFLAKEDPLNALVLARKSIQSVRDHPEGWRIAAAAAKKLDRAEAIFYQDNLAKIQPTKENYLELIRLAVHFRQYPYAIQAVNRAAELAVNEAEYYELAARSYRELGRPLGAKYFLVALTTLRPADTRAQLDLAEIEMSEDPDRKDLALRGRVRALADVPELRVRALSLLLNESIKARLRVETIELMGRLQASPTLGIPEKMLLVEASRIAQPDRTDALLASLLTDASRTPEDSAKVIDFLVAQGWSDRVAPWYASLPDESKSNENVRRAHAEALFELRRWDALRAALLSGNWPSMEYLRRALLSYSYRVEGRSAEFDEAWKGAVVEAGGDIRQCLALLQKVQAWRWEKEAFDVMWRLFSLAPDNAQVRQQLLIWERRQGNTANLNRLFARITDLDANDVVAANNFAYTSLLLDANLTRAGLISQNLVNADPTNPFYITTRSLSLLKQGKPDEALRLFETLRESARAQPERIAVHALLLARNGQSARASERLNNLVRTGLLPEEVRLATLAEQEIARAERAAGNVSRLETLRQSQNQAAAGISESGWIVLLKPAFREKATVDMQLTDSLYAQSDLKGLIEVLREGQWQERDYLRFALLAYARRESGDLPASLDAWRQALRLTQRSESELDDLNALVTRWGWTTERFDVLNRIHTLSPRDPMRLAELVNYYRQAKRTPDLIRVLRLWVDNQSGVTPQMVEFVYYCLISDTDGNRATVLAKTAFEAEPDNTDRRVVYALSLWRQQRAAEAEAILRDVKMPASNLVAAPLIVALVAADNARVADAQDALSRFQPENALPEEVDLSRRLSARLNK